MYSALPAFAAFSVMLTGLKSDAAVKSYRLANFLGEKIDAARGVKILFL
ncbi:MULTISPECIES: hypothetical protein [unclassified Janthinobacterium]|nr:MULTISPECIES: hypothetical protein [unclassified Janthinobacterium]